MKRILCISGSRADYGLLEWPVKVLRESFTVFFVQLNASNPAEAFNAATATIEHDKPDCLLVLGDRWEILQAAIAAHLQRVPIAHIGGGDVALGSYDDAMRDCISILATHHFPTSHQSAKNLFRIGVDGANVWLIGNIALDYIMHGDWKRSPPHVRDYVVISYQAETIDGTVEWEKVVDAVDGRYPIFIRPNADAGSDEINKRIDQYLDAHSCYALGQLPHGDFLNMIYHCGEFIGNSSAMLYEAPALGVKCRMIGKRQQGRVAPEGDGKASERIREVLCRAFS